MKGILSILKQVQTQRKNSGTFAQAISDLEKSLKNEEIIKGIEEKELLKYKGIVERVLNGTLDATDIEIDEGWSEPGWITDGESKKN